MEELYWLDDILPGTKVGRIRRSSISRNVHIEKITDEEIPSNHPVSPSLDLFFVSLDGEEYFKTSSWPNESTKLMKSVEKSRTPMIVVDEVASGQEELTDQQVISSYLPH